MTMERTDLLNRYNLRQTAPSGGQYIPGAEALENLMNQFNDLQQQYDTDPVTGQTIVSKTMRKLIGPHDLDDPYQNYFMSPDNPSWNQNNQMLDMRWILPEGALTGDKFLNRTPPTSDASRMSGFNTGIENMGQEVSTLNPQTHWPDSMFRVPLRDPSGAEDPYLPPEPLFNSVIDFASNRYNVPTQPGMWSQPYGQIQGGVPGQGNNPMIPPAVPYGTNQRQNMLGKM